MAIAIYANKTFQVNSKKVNTFDEFTLGTSLQIENQDAKDKKPSTYIKAPDLDKMSFSIPLKAELGHDIIKEYEDWKTLMESEKSHSFILGNKSVSNTKWIVTSVSLTGQQINKKGKILEGSLQLEFQEYIRPGSAAKSKKNTKKKTATSKNVKTKVSLDKLVYGNSKADNKRNNPNAKVAVAKGVKKG